MTIETSITGGTIMIEDGVKAKEEFAPARKARVELTFCVPEGENGKAYMEGVGRVADKKISEMLGKSAPAAATIQVTDTTVGAIAGKVTDGAKAETAAAKKKRLAAEAAAAPAEKTKADLAKEAGLPAGDTVHKGAAKSDEELLEDEPTINAAGKTVEEDDLNDLLGDAAPVPITDLELANAVQKKNAERKEADPNWAPAKIRDVIATYSGGKRVNDIPAAKRAEFLKKIEALK